MQLRMTVPVELDVEIDSDGKVTHVYVVGSPSLETFLPAIDLVKDKAARAAAYAHATRSRVSEGLVRVHSGTYRGELSYCRFVRSTKVHHILDRHGIEEKYQRKYGRRANASGFYQARVHDDDLAALELGKVKPPAKIATPSERA
jgi:hypothetical protein